MTPVLVGSRAVGPGHAGYLIAEAGSNHDGEIRRALELVTIAAESGVDAVKFQLFRADTLYPRNAGVVETPIGDVDIHETFSQLELPSEWLTELHEAASEGGIDFLISPFDQSALAEIVRIGLKAIKIASPELTHLPLLKAAAETGLPVFMSTGMSTLGDIEEALSVSPRLSDRTVLMQCVTAYPAPENDANVGAIPTLSRAFGTPSGLSDHTLDPTAAPLVAVAMGANAIEKHFTYSRSGSGPDHPFAIEPAELALMVAEIRQLEETPLDLRLRYVEEKLGPDRVTALIGSGRKTIQASEAELAVCDRRAIHAVANIDKGERITSSMVDILRGERNLRPGLHPRYMAIVVDSIAQRSIRFGDGITWGDIVQGASQ